MSTYVSAIVFKVKPISVAIAKSQFLVQTRKVKEVRRRKIKINNFRETKAEIFVKTERP